LRDNARPCPVRGTSILSLHRAMSCFHATSRWYRSYREGILESPSIVVEKAIVRRWCGHRTSMSPSSSPPLSGRVDIPAFFLSEASGWQPCCFLRSAGRDTPNITPGWGRCFCNPFHVFPRGFFLYREGIVGVALSIYREKNHRTRDYSRVAIRPERRPCRSFRNGRDDDHGFSSVKRSIGRRACHHAFFSIQAGR
jgi:hypothetical protein